MLEQFGSKGRTIANTQTMDGLVRILEATRGLKQTAVVSLSRLTIVPDVAWRLSTWKRPLTAA